MMSTDKKIQILEYIKKLDFNITFYEGDENGVGAGFFIESENKDGIPFYLSALTSKTSFLEKHKDIGFTLEDNYTETEYYKANKAKLNRVMPATGPYIYNAHEDLEERLVFVFREHPEKGDWDSNYEIYEYGETLSLGESAFSLVYKALLEEAFLRPEESNNNEFFFQEGTTVINKDDYETTLYNPKNNNELNFIFIEHLMDNFDKNEIEAIIEKLNHYTSVYRNEMPLDDKYKNTEDVNKNKNKKNNNKPTKP